MAEPSTLYLEVKRKQFKAARRTQLKERFFSNKTLLLGTFLIALLVVITLLAPLIATHKPLEVDIVNRLSAPTGSHLFGTDNFGRDLFTRVIYGTRISAEVGFVVALASSAIGLIVGLYASMYKWLDQILMRIMDALYAFPAILLAIAIMAALGSSIQNLMICLIIVFIPAVARIVRSVALVAKEQTYIEAMNALGASHTRIIWRHVMPNTLPALIVQGTFVFAESIIVEAALSFLGAGIPAPTPSLGNLLSEGKQFIFNSWWMTLFPGLGLIFTVLAINLFGDGIRDILDPHGASNKNGGKKSGLFKAWMPSRKEGVKHG